MVGLTAEDSWSGTPTSMPHQHNNAHGDLALDRLGCIDYRFCGISLWLIVCLSWKDKKDKEDWEPASVTLLVDKKWCNGIQNTDINRTKSNQVWSYIKLCLFDYNTVLRQVSDMVVLLLKVYWVLSFTWCIESVMRVPKQSYGLIFTTYTGIPLCQTVTSCSCSCFFSYIGICFTQ